MVVSLRESHQAVWQRKTDIFFLCQLEASTFEIKKQDSEISAAKVNFFIYILWWIWIKQGFSYCRSFNGSAFLLWVSQWMPVEEYVNQPFHDKEGNEMFKLIANICLKRSQNDYTGFILTTNSSKKSLYCSTNQANLLNENGLPSLHLSLTKL